MKLDRTRLLALVNSTPAAARDFTLPSGVVVPMQPMTVVEYLEQQVARFPSVRDMILDPIRAARSLTPDQVKALASADEAAIEAIASQAYDPLASIVTDAASETDVGAAWIACCLGAAGDAEIEAAVKGWSDEDFDAYRTESETRTWGDDASPFFDRVVARMMARKATLARMTPSRQEASRDSTAPADPVPAPVASPPETTGSSGFAGLATPSTLGT